MYIYIYIYIIDRTSCRISITIQFSARNAAYDRIVPYTSVYIYQPRVQREERVARLQRMSERQRERLAAETTDERAARLQHDQESHRGAQSDLPLFEQPSVRARMCKFHAHSLHWNHQDAILVQKHSLVFSFAHSLLSACVVAETSIHQSCILLLTTWTLALCHLSYRLDRLPASYHTVIPLLSYFCSWCKSF